MEKSLDLLMESYKTTGVSSFDKKDSVAYEAKSSVCEDGYCITSECTCDC